MQPQREAWVLMTAMPPTKGHERLIDFAANLDVRRVNVVLATQPDEPFPAERFGALLQIADKYPNRKVFVRWYQRPIQQTPLNDHDEAFWFLWRDILRSYGLDWGDYIVASEHYGATLAEYCRCQFVPFDIERDQLAVRATDIREDPLLHFDKISPSFQPSLRKRITIFGAESCGKTTLSRQLARAEKGFWVPEYARPYLEAVGPEVTDEKMEMIWHGQRALQDSARRQAVDCPIIVQDTDLLSTLGYWEAWSPETVPTGLKRDAFLDTPDLYLMVRSNIPFETDPLRYGGDEREFPDDYWLNVLDRTPCRYEIIEASDIGERLRQAREAVWKMFDGVLDYEREK